LFKFIGVIAGFALYGLIGSIIGYLIGAFIDRARALGTGGMNPLTSALRQAVFLEALFTLMGRLAKADGQVSQQEINHVEQFMQQLGMHADHRTQAIAWFKQGAAPGFDTGAMCRRFVEVCGQTRNLNQTLLVYLIVIALADGTIHTDEDALLVQIAAYLGFNEAAFRQLLQMVLNQAQFGTHPGHPANAADALDAAYRALGVDKDSSDADVKRAYRKLISQYHPDKLIGQGLPEDMVAVATEQAKEIQLAYDLIQKHRHPA
jgi:DnaJ like chaperone protein